MANIFSFLTDRQIEEIVNRVFEETFGRTVAAKRGAAMSLVEAVLEAKKRPSVFAKKAEQTNEKATPTTARGRSKTRAKKERKMARRTESPTISAKRATSPNNASGCLGAPQDDVKGKQLSPVDKVDDMMFRFAETRITKDIANKLGSSFSDEEFLSCWNGEEREVMGTILSHDRASFLKLRCKAEGIDVKWSIEPPKEPFNYAARRLFEKTTHDATIAVFGEDAFGKPAPKPVQAKAKTVRDVFKRGKFNLQEFLEAKISIEKAEKEPTTARGRSKTPETASIISRVLGGLEEKEIRFYAPPNLPVPKEGEEVPVIRKAKVYSYVVRRMNETFIQRGLLAAQKGTFQFFGKTLKGAGVIDALPDEYVLSMFINAVVAAYMRDYLIWAYYSLFKHVKSLLIQKIKKSQEPTTARERGKTPEDLTTKDYEETLARLDAVFQACCLPPETEVFNLRRGRYAVGKPTLRLPQVLMNLTGRENKTLRKALHTYRNDMCEKTLAALFRQVSKRLTEWSELEEKPKTPLLTFPKVNGKVVDSINVLVKYDQRYVRDGKECAQKNCSLVCSLADVLNCPAWTPKQLIFAAFCESDYDPMEWPEASCKVAIATYGEGYTEVSSEERDALGHLDVPQKAEGLALLRMDELIERQYFDFQTENERFQRWERPLADTVGKFSMENPTVPSFDGEGGRGQWSVWTTVKVEDSKGNVVRQFQREFIFLRRAAVKEYILSDGAYRLTEVGGDFGAWYVVLPEVESYQAANFNNHEFVPKGLVYLTDYVEEATDSEGNVVVVDSCPFGPAIPLIRFAEGNIGWDDSELEVFNPQAQDPQLVEKFRPDIGSFVISDTARGYAYMKEFLE